MSPDAIGGADGIRTRDLLRDKQALSAPTLQSRITAAKRRRGSPEKVQGSVPDKINENVHPLPRNRVRAI